MPQAAKETVDVTSLIKGILNGYPGSSAILREYLQNSDDAKANIQVIFLMNLICLTFIPFGRFLCWMKNRMRLQLWLILAFKTHKDLP